MYSLPVLAFRVLTAIAAFCAFRTAFAASLAEDSQVCRAEIPVEYVLDRMQRGPLLFSTSDRTGAPAFQCEVFVAARVAGNGRDGEGIRILLDRDEAARGAMFFSRNGFPYANLTQVRKGRFVTLGLKRPGTLGLVEGGAFRIEFPAEEGRQLIYDAGPSSQIHVDLEAMLRSIIARSESLSFDAPTLTYVFNEPNATAQVVVADQLEWKATGSPILSITVTRPASTIAFRAIRSNRRVLRSPLLSTGTIEVDPEDVAQLEFGTPEAQRVMQPVSRAFVIVTRQAFDDRRLRDLSLSLLRSVGDFASGQLTEIERQQFSETIRVVLASDTPDGWRKDFDRIRSLLERTVIRPTRVLETDDDSFARQEYRREWASDRFEATFGPVLWNEFHEAAAKVIRDRSRPVELRLRWLDLLGEVGLSFDSSLLTEFEAVQDDDKNEPFGVVLSSVRARTSIPTNKDLDRLLASVGDVALPLEVRCIGLEAVCLRHAFDRLDRDQIWDLLPEIQREVRSDLVMRLFLAMLVDPAGLSWIVRSHEGVQLKSLGPEGLHQIGFRVRRVAAGKLDGSAESSGLARDYLACVRAAALDQRLDRSWRAAAAAEGAWGHGGEEFAREILPIAFASEEPDWNRSGLVVMADAQLTREWLPSIAKAATSRGDRVALMAARSLREHCRHSAAARQPQPIWRLLEILLRNESVGVRLTALDACWHLARNKARIPEPMRDSIRRNDKDSVMLIERYASVAVAWQAANPDEPLPAPVDADGDLELLGRVGWWRENISTLRQQLSSE